MKRWPTIISVSATTSIMYLLCFLISLYWDSSRSGTEYNSNYTLLLHPTHAPYEQLFMATRYCRFEIVSVCASSDYV